MNRSDETPRYTPPPISLKCDRWPECKERHDMLLARVQELEREKREDLAKIWDELRSMARSIAQVAASVGRLDGRVAGYLLAGMVVAAAVSVMATRFLK